MSGLGWGRVRATTHGVEVEVQITPSGEMYLDERDIVAVRDMLRAMADDWYASTTAALAVLRSQEP